MVRDQDRDGALGLSAWSQRPFQVFVLVEAAAFVFYLAIARTQWFFADEWEFLSGRGLYVHDLMRAHYGHWVALPIIVYRALWNIVGLRSYLPYVGLTIALHLTAAALLRVVMRRSGVRPWTATVAASAFALFGAGAQDVLWAFQLTFTGALVLGLVHLLLADHDGPFDRRDCLGVGAGLLGLMCSGVAVTMVIVVGVATLARRSWRIAALHTAPLGAVYGAWWLRYSHGKYSYLGSARQILDWWFTGAAGLFGALGSVPGVGWVLAALLIGGSVLALRDSGIGATRRELVLPAALLVGGAVFLIIAAFDRSGLSAHFAKSSRYLHILAALVLPPIAVAIDALLRRSRPLGAVAMAALLVGTPGNLGKANDFGRKQRLIDDSTRQSFLSIPRSPLALEVPAALRPDPNLAPTVTLGWLLAGAASGRIPRASRKASPRQRFTNRLRLSVMELDEPSGLACRALSRPLVVHLEKGASIGLEGRAFVILLGRKPARSSPVSFGTGLLEQSTHHTLVAVDGPLTLQFVPPRSGPAAALCPHKEPSP